MGTQFNLLSRSIKFFSGRCRLFFMPTFSNIGECESVDSPGIRPLQVVVFGSPGKRRHAHTLVASLGGYRRMFGPQVRVVDIGEYLDFSLGRNLMIISRNVVFTNAGNIMKADVIEINISTKDNNRTKFIKL